MPKKRASGDGGVWFDAKRDRWVCELEADRTGKRGPRRFLKTQKEANAKLRQLRAEREAGMNHNLADMTVSAYLDMWLQHKIDSGKLGLGTIENYRTHINRIVGYIGDIKIRQLAPKQTQDMFNAFRQTYTIGSIGVTRSILMEAIDQACPEGWGYITFNPLRRMGGSDLPCAPQSTITALTEEQVQMLLDTIAGHRLEALIVTAIWLGMRRGELLALRWEDVDLISGTITVHASVRRVNGVGFVRSSTKNKKARIIPIDSLLVEMLRAHRARMLREQLATDRWDDSTLVFPSERGTYLDPSHGLHEPFKALCVEAGLPATTRFHDLRHTAISLMLANGGLLKDVSDIAGHSSIKITGDRYAHAYDEGKRKAIEGMRDVMKRKKAH